MADVGVAQPSPAAPSFPGLDSIFTVETVSVVKEVSAGQLKQALEYLYDAVADLQTPKNFCVPEDLNRLRSELRAEFGAELEHLRQGSQAQEEVAAAQQVRFPGQLSAATVWGLERVPGLRPGGTGPLQQSHTGSWVVLPHKRQIGSICFPIAVACLAPLSSKPCSTSLEGRNR